jgi:hypothetical protein
MHSPVLGRKVGRGFHTENLKRRDPLLEIRTLREVSFLQRLAAKAAQQAAASDEASRQH